MTTLTQPHRTRGHRPGDRAPLTDITICIQPTPGIEPKVWRALCTDVKAAIDASLERHGLLAVRNGDGHRPLGPRSQEWDIPL
jgi:hypothetical protein